MRKRMGSLILLLAAVALIGTLVRTTVPVAVAEQTQLPRTPDGKPDLNGIWQAIGTAHWDLEDHSARAGALVPLGAVGAVPAGKTVVEGGEIPYQPWAVAKKEENAAQWLTLDPEIKCYLPGVPRVMYLPFPFQIVQSPGFMLIGSEYVGATRSIHMEDVEPPPIDTFMGALARTLGGRHARHRIQQLQRPDLVRSGRQLSQRGATGRRADDPDQP